VSPSLKSRHGSLLSSVFLPRRVSLGATVTAGLGLFIYIIIAFAARLCSAPCPRGDPGRFHHWDKDPRADEFPVLGKGCRGTQQTRTKTWLQARRASVGLVLASLAFSQTSSHCANTPHDNADLAKTRKQIPLTFNIKRRSNFKATGLSSPKQSHRRPAPAPEPWPGSRGRRGRAGATRSPGAERGRADHAGTRLENRSACPAEERQGALALARGWHASVQGTLSAFHPQKNPTPKLQSDLSCTQTPKRYHVTPEDYMRL